MKFRDLKNHSWQAHFTYFEATDYEIKQWYEAYNVFITYNGKYFEADAEEEYDNGLYIETSRYRIPITWAALKRNMKACDNSNYNNYFIEVFTGYCPKCGKQISEETFFKHYYTCEACERKRFDLADED